jgi:hypothetical protein
MTYDLSQAKDLSMGGQLIKAGSLVKCKITVDAEKLTGNNNAVHNTTLEVVEGEFKGSKFFDNIFVTGGAKEWGESKMKAIVEFSDNAHVNPAQYRIKSPMDLNGKYALVKTKLENYQKKDGTWGHAAKADTYGSPNPKSPTYPIYEAYRAGEQPWQTDDKPKLPVSVGVVSDASYGHASQDIPL